MKKMSVLLAVALMLGLFACNSSNDQDPELAELSEEMTEKSVLITASEVEIEAAAVESDYEVEFYANAETLLTSWWRVGKRFTWSQKLRYYTNQCPEVEIASLGDDEYPKTITLDYGDSTLLRNGKVLGGVIVIEISAPRTSDEYTRQVTYNNFVVDSMEVNGTADVEIDKVDSVFRKISSDLTFSMADGSEVQRSSERIWQWISGLDTEDDQSDDILTISGQTEATITWTDGTTQSYKKEITTPLKRIADCRYIVDGQVEVLLDSELVSVLDYGYAESDEECDAYAQLSTAEGDEIIDLSTWSAKRYKNKKQSGN